eukprot:scaffold147790_cov29-Tisochrysis_lutea.AAC.4
MRYEPIQGEARAEGQGRTGWRRSGATEESGTAVETDSQLRHDGVGASDDGFFGADERGMAHVKGPRGGNAPPRWVEPSSASVSAHIIIVELQATNFGLAVDEINRMLAWRLSDEPPAPCPDGIVEGSEEDTEIRDPAERAKVKTTIFLGCTSNLISAGTRETVHVLAHTSSSGGHAGAPQWMVYAAPNPCRCPPFTDPLPRAAQEGLVLGDHGRRHRGGPDEMHRAALHGIERDRRRLQPQGR